MKLKCISVIFLTQSILYNGLVVYAPALAMNQVAGLDINIAIIVVGCVCIFYTSIGGMKAVIWTDVYQSIWMLSGFLAVIIAATIDRVSQTDFVTFMAFYTIEFN